MQSRARQANPEAIAWYLGRSERLLDELRDRVQSLRSRGGQLAGFSGAVLALVGANADSILESLPAPLRFLAGLALLAGSISLISAFVTALRGASIPRGVSDISAREAANYLTERFTSEPDLWRVHLRTLKALIATIDATTQQGDAVARSVASAGRFFIAGLLSVGAALSTLVIVVMSR